MLVNTQQISMPQDVRHMGVDDAMTAVAVANVTKQLSERDYTLAAGFNALITELQGLVLAVPIVLPRVSLSALAIEWLGNFRIPKNYTATIINASVAASPVAGSVTLNVLHSAGTYGQSGSGPGVTNLVSTTGEYAVTGDYVGEGELIFKLASSSTQRTSVSASLLVVLKPTA